jgi:hypothetical protein
VRERERERERERGIEREKERERERERELGPHGRTEGRADTRRSFFTAVFDLMTKNLLKITQLQLTQYVRTLAVACRWSQIYFQISFCLYQRLVYVARGQLAEARLGWIVPGCLETNIVSKQ